MMPEADLSLGSGARFSGCRHYRPALWHSWAPELGTVVFIDPNPSTADADRDDPTSRRCRTLAADRGHGAMIMVNLFDYTATRPSDLKRKRAPVARCDDAVLVDACRDAALIVAAWGGHGLHRDRSSSVRERLSAAELSEYGFGIGKQGEPLHPLYPRREACARTVLADGTGRSRNAPSSTARSWREDLPRR